MRVTSLTAICLAGVAATFLFFSPKVLAMEGQASGQAYKKGEILVKFKHGAAEVLEGQLSNVKSAGLPKVSASLDELSQRCRVKKIRPLIRGFKSERQRVRKLFEKDKASLTKREERILRRQKRAPKGAKVPELDRIYKIELEEGQSAEEAVEEYRQNPDVEYAELNYVVHSAVSPDDAYYGVQWALNNTGQMYPVSGGGTESGTANVDINAPEAWDIYTGSSDIVVAVIDSGIDYTHRDLAGNMWTDANGSFGFDFVNSDNDPMDDFGHGTHCAGIIAGRGNNGTDIAGICWNAKVMAVKFINFNNQGYTGDAVNAIYYAVDNGADILSNSWGGSIYSLVLEQAINYAYSQGVVTVAAVGNENSDTPFYPAYFNHVISVTATDSNDQKASFSNYGEWVDIAAPGVDILSLRAENTDMYLGIADYIPRDCFVPFGDADATMYVASGTSMACPQVAGACALLLSTNALMTGDEISDILMDTVDPIADGICSCDGRLNLSRALVEAIQSMSKGHIALDSDYYSCDSDVGILLTDGDLAGEGVCSISLTTTSGDSETVILTEASSSGAFAGTIHAISGEPNLEDGNLQVVNEDIVYATYYDTNDGTGNPATVTDTSEIDCIPPLISNIQPYIMASELTVTFDVDEPASAEVLCGTVCGGPYTLEGRHSEFQTNHTVEVSPLLPFTTYYFIVSATDAAGNETTDSNNGNCYSFVTTGPGDIYIPSQYSTIQEGIDHSWPGSTVLIADGVYKGEGNRDIDFLGRALTVKSENGPENCVIDCQGNEEYPHRGFYFENYEDANSIVDGLTITNGYGPSDYWDGFEFVAAGGGIFCYYSSPTIKNCIITCNRTSYSPDSVGGFGGGICCEASNPVIVNCKITDNISGKAPGGGIFGHDTNVSIIECEISGNSAGHGCGVYIEQGNPVIDGCIVRNNMSNGESRGSLYFGLGTSLEISNCLITGNTSYPGGICCWTGGSNATISNCTVVGNNRVELGGAIYWKGSATVTNCICRDNHELGLSGGLREIYENLTVSYTNIQDNGEPNDWGYIAGAGNIDTDPCFVPGYGGDYYLSQIAAGQAVDSPCVDSGSDTAANFGMDMLTTRTDSYPDKGLVNMGYHYLSGRTADADENRYVDFFDFAILAADWLECSDPCDSSCTATDLLGGDIIIDDYVDARDLAFFAASWLDCLVEPAIFANPVEGAVVDPNVILRWTAGKGALEHDVYLGTDPNAVAEADYFSEEYMGTVSDEIFDPCLLDANETYFWRIDEAGPRCVTKGDIWNFRVWIELSFVSWWKFDEGIGDIAYDSAGSNNGNIYGAAWTTGRIGSALDFNGVYDYVRISDDSSLDISGAITVSAWIKLNDNVNGQTIAAKMRSGGGYYGGGYCLAFSNSTTYSDGTFRLVFQKADGNEGTASGNYGTNTNWDRVVSEKNDWETGIWYHVAVTWDGTTDTNSLKMYVNGVSDVSHTAGQGTIKTNDHALQIGRSLYTEPWSQFDGIIDDVMIFERELSAEEVGQLYESGL